MILLNIAIFQGAILVSIQIMAKLSFFYLK